jgi:UDP-GlcNAc:undecaprenyl-phosphate GlcNAc-1-phosphate transferase
MDNILNLVVFPLTLTVLISYIATPYAIKFAHKIGIVDDPKKSSHPKVIHTYPVPRGGGIALFASIALASFLFLPIDKHLIGIIIGALIITVMGIADDKYKLNPYLRLAVGFIAAGAPIIAGIGIAFITNPFNGTIDLSNPQLTFELLGEVRSIWILSDFFALFWIVFLMNMLNMGAKGVDGQLTGTVVIAALTIAALSLQYSADIAQWPVIILAIIIAGAYLGFLPWHIYPQKIMPSYGGATLAGYLLAVVSILSTTKVGTLLVVLGVPVVDTGYTIVRRLASGKSPVWGDTGHLHHKLLKAGWSKKRVALFYWLATGILGVLALYLNTSYKLYTIVGVMVFVGGLLLWLTYRPKA